MGAGRARGVGRSFACFGTKLVSVALESYGRMAGVGGWEGMASHQMAEETDGPEKVCEEERMDGKDAVLDAVEEYPPAYEEVEGNEVRPARRHSVGACECLGDGGKGGRSRENIEAA